MKSDSKVWSYIIMMHSYHGRICRARVKDWNVGRILVHDRPSTVADLLAHEPAVIRAKTLDVRAIPIDDVFEVELVLEGAGRLQVRIGLAREGYTEERLPFLLAIGRQFPSVCHVVHGHGGLP